MFAGDASCCRNNPRENLNAEIIPKRRHRNAVKCHESPCSVDNLKLSQMSTTTLFTTGKALLTIEEAAELLHTSISTLRRYIDQKRIAICKPGGKRGKVFIRPLDLEAFISRTRRAAIGE